MASELHSNLKSQVDYVESHGGVIVITAAMYRRRHVFEADDGQFYVMTEIAGFDTFPTIKDAISAIDAHPNKYPTSPKHRV